MKKILPILIICGIFAVAIPVLANGDAVVIPDPLGNKTITEIIDSIITYVLIPIAFGIALIMIIWGGIQIMIGTSTGEKENKLKQGKKTITWAIIGLAIVIASKFIVEVIEAVLKGI